MLWKRLYLNIFLEMRVLALLWVVLCGIRTTNADSHALKYFYTGVTVGTDFPEFTIVGLVDDEPFVYYDSNIRKMIPKTEWMKEIEGEEYWDSESRRVNVTQQCFLETIGIVMQRFSQTQGVHTLQRMYRCEWDDETNVTGGFSQYAYDGRDFVIYDTNGYRYKEAVQEGFEIALKWNYNPAKLKRSRHFLTKECVDWLKKYVTYGKSALEWTVAPEVSLLQKNSSSPVTCHVTGFYPRGVNVTWQKDGVYQDVDVELGETLPNEDGTFRISSHLWVKPEAWKRDRYTCTVQHKSLKQPIVLQVTESDIKSNRCVTDPEGCSPPVGIIIIGCVVGALLLILTVIGVFIWRKRSSDSDTASESSNTTAVPGPDSGNCSLPLVSVTAADSSNTPAATGPDPANVSQPLVSVIAAESSSSRNSQDSGCDSVFWGFRALQHTFSKA